MQFASLSISETKGKNGVALASSTRSPLSGFPILGSLTAIISLLPSAERVSAEWNVLAALRKNVFNGR